MPLLDWNVPAMFDHAGGTKGVLALCRAAGTAEGDALKPATVNVWRHRKRISGEWVPVVVAGLVAQGMTLDAMLCVPVPTDPRQIELNLDALPAPCLAALGL